MISDGVNDTVGLRSRYPAGRYGFQRDRCRIFLGFGRSVLSDGNCLRLASDRGRFIVHRPQFRGEARGTPEFGVRQGLFRCPRQRSRLPAARNRRSIVNRSRSRVQPDYCKSTNLHWRPKKWPVPRQAKSNACNEPAADRWVSCRHKKRPFLVHHSLQIYSATSAQPSPLLLHPPVV